MTVCLASFASLAEMYSGPFMTCRNPNTGNFRSYIENRKFHFTFELPGTYMISVQIARQLGLPEGLSKAEFALNAEDCLFNEVQFRMYCSTKDVSLKFTGVDIDEAEVHFDTFEISTSNFGAGEDAVQVILIKAQNKNRYFEMEDRHLARYVYGAPGGSGMYLCERRADEIP